MEHRVEFTAEVVRDTLVGNEFGALVARCSCGWHHTFLPNPGREDAILDYGLHHVRRAAKGQEDAPSFFFHPAPSSP